MKEWVERHNTAVFLIATFGTSWPLWLVSGALTRTPIRAPDLAWLVAQVGVFAPALAGMVIAAVLDPRTGRHSLRTLAVVYVPATVLGLWIATRGYASFVEIDGPTTLAMVVVAAWVMAWFAFDRNRPLPWPAAPASRSTIAVWSLVGATLMVGPFLVAWALAGGARSTLVTLPQMPARDLTPVGLAVAFAVNLLYGGSLGEEPGWRGAWLPRLLRHRTPIAASVVISVWWAFWHAPIDLAQGFGLTGVGGLLIRQIWTLPVTVLFTWVTLRAGGSLVAPLVMHTSLNVVPDFALADPGRYEAAIGLLGVFMSIAAGAAVLHDATLRSRLPTRQAETREEAAAPKM
jgi:membrane protease YdiL (CAAX protease family)